jgi:hypothetical protein
MSFIMMEQVELVTTTQQKTTRRSKMAKAKPFTYTKRGRPSKADIAARKKAERQEMYKMYLAIFGFATIIGMVVYSALT